MSALKRLACELNELFFACLAHNYQCDINCIFEFSGRLDVERLTNAFLTVLTREPLWSYRFVPWFWHPGWEEIPRSERGGLVKVETTNGTHAALQAVMRGPVDAAARLFVFRGPSDDSFCLRLDHRLADATAARLFVEALSTHYAAGDIPPATDAPLVRRTSQMLLPQFPPAVRRTAFAKLQQQGKAAKQAPPAYHVPPTTADDPADLPPLLQFGPGTLDELTARAMRDRGTPTLAVLAATYLGLRDTVGIAPQSALHLGMAVDLRRYLPPEQLPAPACMLVGRAQFPVGEPRTPTIADVMERLRAGIATERGPTFGLTMSPLVLDLPIVRLILNVIPFRFLQSRVGQRAARSDLRPDIQISDVGEFGQPGDRWGDAVLQQAYCTCGTWGVPGSISILLGTCGSRLTVVVGTSPRSFAAKLADAIQHHLCEYVGWSPDRCERG